MADTQRPNILCLVSEDCPPRLGAYGDPVARTPHLDRLAAEGVRWENANCTSPICAPSRFAILTGRHAETLPRAQHMRSGVHLPDAFDTYSQLMRDAGYYCTNNFKTDYCCDVDPQAIWDDCSESGHWRNRPEGTPFLAVFNPMTTHESSAFDPQEGPTRHGDVRVPAYLPDTPGMREGLVRQYNAIHRMDARMGEILAQLEADGLAEDTIVFYFSDHGSVLPRSKRYLYDEGLRVPMILRVPSKWRHLLPYRPGSRIEAPLSLVDLLPSFLTVAGAPVPSEAQGQSFVGPEATPRRFAFAGRHRQGERYDLSRTARSARYRYIRNYQPHRILGQYVAYEWIGPYYQDYEQAYLDGTLTEAQARFFRAKPFEEFYDMQADPESLTNLAGDPRHAEALQAHRAALDAHMWAIRDTGFIPEKSPLEDWQASRDEGTYPLERLMALAARAAQAGPADLEDMLAPLDDRNPVIRYWAAQGLLNIADKGHPLPEAVAHRARAETDVHTQIALCEALARQSLRGVAVPEAAREWVAVLTDIVAQEGDPRIRLQAMEGLTYAPHFPELSLPVLDALHGNPDQYLNSNSKYLAQVLRGTYRPQNDIFDWASSNG